MLISNVSRRGRLHLTRRDLEPDRLEDFLLDRVCGTGSPHYLARTWPGGLFPSWLPLRCALPAGTSRERSQGRAGSFRFHPFGELLPFLFQPAVLVLHGRVLTWKSTNGFFLISIENKRSCCQKPGGAVPSPGLLQCHAHCIPSARAVHPNRTSRFPSQVFFF